MSIRIVKQGMFDSIQDLGRNGFQHLGINPGGAMDQVAAQVANFLAGNDEGEPVIEMHFPPASFLFNEDALIAISGADFTATLNDLEIPINKAIIVKKFSVLQFSGQKFSARCYLAVNGGFDLPKWLNSYSTNLKAKTGGFKGRNLMKEDQLRFRKHNDYTSLLKEKDCVIFPWRADTSSFYSSANVIRICSGAEFDQLNDASKELLTSSTFTTTQQSDSMGYRMKGLSMKLKTQDELLSSAVTTGTIQLFPDGQIIILMTNHQTTGGYPRLAHVISADISKLAQLLPGAEINFQMISLAEAEALLLLQQKDLKTLKHSCALHLSELLGDDFN